MNSLKQTQWEFIVKIYLEKILFVSSYLKYIKLFFPCQQCWKFSVRVFFHFLPFSFQMHSPQLQLLFKPYQYFDFIQNVFVINQQ